MTIPSVTLGGKSWSICYWYKCDTTQINGGYVFGFMQDNGMNYFSNYFNNNALCFSINNGMNSKIYYFTSNSCCDNKWRHVTLVYNFTLSKYFMYFNGVLCTNSISASGDFFNVAATYSMNDLGGIGGNSAVFFSSTLIDDFRVYSNVALGISDIAYISGNNKYYTNNDTSVIEHVVQCEPVVVVQQIHRVRDENRTRILQSEYTVHTLFDRIVRVHEFHDERVCSVAIIVVHQLHVR